MKTQSLFVALVVCSSLFSEMKDTRPVAPSPQKMVPSTARGCPDSSGPFGFVSFIYWKNQFDNLDVTSTTKVNTDGTFTIKTHPVKTSYDPGFKLALGYNFNFDRWDLLLDWTRLTTEQNQSKSAPAGLYTILAGIPHADDVDRQDNWLASELNSRWKFHFNVLDLELGRNFMMGKYVALRPFAGLKSAWILYQIRTTYTTLITTSLAPAPVDQLNVRLQDHMWGIGPRLGFNSRWAFGNCGLGFLANMAGSLLWERFHPKNQEDTFTVKSDRNQLKSVLETFVGFDWGRCFAGTYYLDLSVGYEAQFWLDQMLVSYAQEPYPNESLNLFGLTATARLEF